MQIAWCIGNQDERTGISWATISVKLNQTALAADGTYLPVSPEFFSEKVVCTPDGHERGGATLLQIVVNGRASEIVA
jgi:hypothetical protein